VGEVLVPRGGPDGASDVVVTARVSTQAHVVSGPWTTTRWPGTRLAAPCACPGRSGWRSWKSDGHRWLIKENGPGWPRIGPAA
jgi:hypothetical protein